MKLRFALLVLLAVETQAQTLAVRGFLTGRAAGVSGPPSWTSGDWGKFDLEDGEPTLTGEVGVDWNPSKYFGAHVHGLVGPDASGLVAGFLEGRFEGDHDRFQVRAGQFFLPTSRENRGDLWSSPYTISFSAINTWMGQEVRPVGVDLEWRHTTDAFNALTIGATAFQNNDTMGTLLAWRGWTIGNRLPVYDELVPLPPLWSLPVFTSQNPEGTTPFRNDLDGMIGWAARARVTIGDRAAVQVTRLDNRGDYLLYGDEYSWNTKFTLIGAEIGNSEHTVLAGEWMDGYTGMGPYLDFLPKGRPIIADFESWYALLSHKRGRNRFSARYDAFAMEDLDGSRAETNEEEGVAWTVAWLFDLTPHFRTGVEFTQISADSALAEQILDARSVTFEVRYSFWR